MTEPEITVRKLAYYQPIQLLDLDEQGRQTYRCPNRGCGETAYFDENGLGHCPVGDAEQEFLAKALEEYERLFLKATGPVFEASVFRHVREVICSCPAIDVTDLPQQLRGERHTVPGYHHTCKVHGIGGTDPTYPREID